ncbi:MAG: glycosyltransferase family 4 protein [Deltaproteobacteria bacterium]|nr:glycosyltransferase family 4 protein [Deltaproteobacteria bacterium]
MPKMLDGMGKRLRWHVPNAIQPPDEAHSADREGCTFLYMNSIKPFRHPELCLEAFLRMCTKMGLDNKSNIKLLIVGMSSSVSSPATRRKEEKLRQMIKGCNVPVELHSWTNDPAAFFREANVFLLPSDIVYVNYALLEAMGRGLPVIVQNAEGVEQLVESGLEGYVEEKDVDAWEKAMTKLAESSELRAAMGKAARERIIASFSYERYVERYARIYDYIMGESGKCPPENS